VQSQTGSDSQVKAANKGRSNATPHPHSWIKQAMPFFYCLAGSLERGCSFGHVPPPDQEDPTQTQRLQGQANGLQADLQFEEYLQMGEHFTARYCWKGELQHNKTATSWTC
jgi:hypothetical protein